MSSDQYYVFKTIDDILEQYYTNQGIKNYRNSDGLGIFLQYIIDQDLIDEELPIERELGYKCNPAQCAYSWYCSETNTIFPIPPYIKIPDEQMEVYIFYILQYCYKFGKAPNQHYIKEIILPKIPGAQIRDCDGEYDDDGDEYFDVEGLTEEIKSLNEASDFVTKPIGAKRNIYIDKQFTKIWMNRVTPKFIDEAMMFYWLDYTTAIQMVQKYAKQYINKITRKFLVAIINYELHDNNNHTLYGIILCDDNKDKLNDKYPYKLSRFMNEDEIFSEFGIHGHDLPLKSRKHPKFIQQLQLTRNIEKQDLNQINWPNLKLFKSQSTNTDPLNKSVTITQSVMNEYINISLERMNYNNLNINNNINNNTANTQPNQSQNQYDLIPIVVVDKYSYYYEIQWVMIVRIIHRDCYIGVSFRWSVSKQLFMATAIYLDKGEIESKHRLIGLKCNLCKNLPSFSLKKFKFKSGKNAVIEDDDDIAIHSNNNAILQYQAEIQKFHQLYQSEVQSGDKLQTLYNTNELSYSQQLQPFQPQFHDDDQKQQQHLRDIPHPQQCTHHNNAINVHYNMNDEQMNNNHIQPNDQHQHQQHQQFKCKSGKNVVIEDDDDIAIYSNNNAILQYQAEIQKYHQSEVQKNLEQIQKSLDEFNKKQSQIINDIAKMKAIVFDDNASNPGNSASEVKPYENGNYNELLFGQLHQHPVSAKFRKKKNKKTTPTK